MSYGTVFCVVIFIGAVYGNNWENLRDNCAKDSKNLGRAEFNCLIMQFDKNYDNIVNELEFAAGWRHEDLDYYRHAAVFFLETDVTGDYQITTEDLQYFMALWDSNGDHIISEKELGDGWDALYHDRYN